VPTLLNGIPVLIVPLSGAILVLHTDVVFFFLFIVGDVALVSINSIAAISLLDQLGLVTKGQRLQHSSDECG
jgi:hypothetical protein